MTMRDPSMQITRRRFLDGMASTATVVSLGGVVPSFLVEAAEGGSREETVLVVIQLSGGNDGLNTIVPYTDQDYYSARPSLAIPRDQVLRIDDQFGFHPALRGWADLLEAGQLSIVQGVGYAAPNRSHFESMDIWHTCRRKGELRETGWLGRFLDAKPADAAGDAPAIHLGDKKQPLALMAQDVRVPSVRSLDRFRLYDGGDKDLRDAIRQLSASQRPGRDSLLGFIQTSTASALAASERVEAAGQKYKPSVEYPENALAKKLQTAARLIDAGLGTRIYYVQIDGFDTHSQQAGAHTALLRQLSSAASAFIADMNNHGHGDRVLVFGFSEFGRRVKENASQGTDHGAAAPVFFAGQRVKAGLTGAHPSLHDLVDGDLKFHTDFRSVYATILQRWLGWPSEAVLGGRHEPVDVIA